MIGTTFLIGAALVILVIVWSDGARHATRSAVRRRRPAASLLTGRWTRHLVEGLAFAGFTPPPRYLGFYVVSVEEAGLGLWRGVIRVRRFSFIPWNRIDAIQLGLDKDSVGELDVVQLIVNRQGPGTTITLAVSRSPWQAGVAPSSELAEISLDLQSRLETSRGLS